MIHSFSLYKIFIDTAPGSDDWMDSLMAGNDSVQAIDPFLSLTKELDDYLDSKVVPRGACEDIIAWWGVSLSNIMIEFQNLHKV